tara:strand:- start:310 stop:1215 length:906 start_codon:yes stop_codon:yes gene_type:complete
MVDITDKKNSLREATAQAIIRVNSLKTINAIEQNKVPKGNVFEISRAAGLLGIKKTSELLPDCHPIPIEYANFDFKIKDLEIQILCTIKTIYKTGVEVEAMHGASIVALNIYDMLKPIDKEIEIQQIKLLQKKGGKTDFHKLNSKVNAAVVVCSDSISIGENEDKAGKAIEKALNKWDVKVDDYSVIPDNIEQIQKSLLSRQKRDFSIVIFTGGTGLSPRDVTPEAIKPLLDKNIPGIEESMRSYGQNRTRYAMLSRSVVGIKKSTLVLALPGSKKGALESINAIFPEVLHLFDILKGAKH